jgi:hypothetical protein
MELRYQNQLDDYNKKAKNPLTKKLIAKVVTERDEAL